MRNFRAIVVLGAMAAWSPADAANISEILAVPAGQCKAATESVPKQMAEAKRKIAEQVDAGKIDADVAEELRQGYDLQAEGLHAACDGFNAMSAEMKKTENIGFEPDFSGVVLRCDQIIVRLDSTMSRIDALQKVDTSPVKHIMQMLRIHASALCSVLKAVSEQGSSPFPPSSND